MPRSATETLSARSTARHFASKMTDLRQNGNIKKARAAFTDRRVKRFPGLRYRITAQADGGDREAEVYENGPNGRSFAPGHHMLYDPKRKQWFHRRYFRDNSTLNGVKNCNLYAQFNRSYGYLCDEFTVRGEQSEDDSDSDVELDSEESESSYDSEDEVVGPDYSEDLSWGLNK